VLPQKGSQPEIKSFSPPARTDAPPTCHTHGLTQKGTMHHHDPRPPICGEPATLPSDLVLTALRYANRPETVAADIRDVRCTLQAHPTGDHYAFILDTTATTSAWTRWPHGGDAQIVLVLPDCPITDPDQDGACSEYENHYGEHTWQVDDPWNPVEPAR
jgi:hypothetical protein